jgi:septum site-determining protein MinC
MKYEETIMKNKNETVTIKSFSNGISLYLDNELPFEELLEEIARKFAASAGFFKNATMALSFEGRWLDSEEEKAVVKTIRANCNINILCLIGKDEQANHNYLKALQLMNYDAEQKGSFYRETLKSGQVLQADTGIVLIGDVNPGATIVSGSDIIILGGLYGEARAGTNGKEGHFIMALEMAPERLMIGDYEYASKEKSKWSFKVKVQPKIAYLKQDQADGTDIFRPYVVIEALSKEALP